MHPWTLLPALVLVTISALAVYRHWSHRPSPSADHLSWFRDTTSGLQLPAEPALPDTSASGSLAEQEFYVRQFRRRMQASLMMGAVGLLLPLAGWIVDPLWNVVYVAVLLSLIGWMLLLGIADLVATRHHFNRVREQMLAEMVAVARAEIAADDKRPEPE